MRTDRLLALIFFLFCASFLSMDARQEESYTDITIWDFYVPKLPSGERLEKKELYLSDKFLDTMESVEITITLVTYESIGWHFITAYCPAECGWNGDPDNLTGWYTASGEICHRADDTYTEFSTCAIDRSIYSFGDEFYIPEFGLFVAEDTGAFSGYWLDLFYEDYQSVLNFPTGYYEVFSVNREEITIRLEGR